MSNSATRFVKMPPETTEIEAEALNTLIEDGLNNVVPGLVSVPGSWPRRTDISGPGTGNILRDTNNNVVIAWPFDGPYAPDYGSPPTEQHVPCPNTLDPQALIIVDTPDYPFQGIPEG